MDSTQIVGEKIKMLRKIREISIAELAERTGLAEEQIERIENNIDIPSLAPLIKIARALGVRLGTFLDDQDEHGAVVCRKQETNDTISFSNNAMALGMFSAKPLMETYVRSEPGLTLKLHPMRKNSLFTCSGVMSLVPRYSM